MEAREGKDAATVAAVARIRIMMKRNRKKVILRQKVSIFIYFNCAVREILRQKVSIYFNCAVKVFKKELENLCEVKLRN